MTERIDNLKETLKERGYKLTPQRRAVLNVIIEHNDKHLSSEEVYDYVKKDCPEIGLATVYRTLQLLSDLDVISKINFDDGCARFELNINTGDHQHHHAICSNCGKVIEIELDLLDELEEEIKKNYGFVVTDHRVQLYGLCENCK